MGKTDSGRYELKLGPLAQVNNAKIICGALVREGLPCGVERVDLTPTASTMAAPVVESVRVVQPAVDKLPANKSSVPSSVVLSKAEELAQGQAWLVQQSPRYYTLQLASALNYEGVKALRDRLGQGVILEQAGAKQTSYVLLLGAFATREQAFNQISTLDLATPPWIRRMGDLVSP
jgi:septal ring-binding cell division protein DamX